MCVFYSDDSGVRIVPHEDENWKNAIIIACTIMASVEIVIVAFMIAHWKKIRWTLRKMNCPCVSLLSQTQILSLKQNKFKWNVSFPLITKATPGTLWDLLNQRLLKAHHVRLAEMLACRPLTWQVVSSPPGRVIPRTIIKMVQTASLHGTQCVRVGVWQCSSIV